MHACFVKSRRSWRTICVLLTETNNPCVTTPVSLTACNRANVGGVCHCVLPPWGQWQEVSSTMTREKPIYIYRLFTHQHYIRVMGKSILRCWKCRTGTACGIIVILDALTWQTNISKSYTTIRRNHTSKLLVVFSLLIPLVSCPTHLQHHLQPPGPPGLLPVSESWCMLSVFSIAELSFGHLDFICHVQRGPFGWISLPLLTRCSTAMIATLTTDRWGCQDVRSVKTSYITTIHIYCNVNAWSSFCYSLQSDMLLVIDVFGFGTDQ